MNEEQEIKEQSLTAAPVVEHSTPEEEDEAMKEIYERPSPSPTDSIGSSIIDAKENEIPTYTNVISEVTTQDQPEQDLKTKKDEEEDIIETDGKKDINDANVESNNEKEVVDVNTATD